MTREDTKRKAVVSLTERFVRHVETQERRDITPVEREQFRKKAERIAERNQRKK
jgi:hypothetical protein